MYAFDNGFPEKLRGKGEVVRDIFAVTALVKGVAVVVGLVAEPVEVGIPGPGEPAIDCGYELVDPFTFEDGIVGEFMDGIAKEGVEGAVKIERQGE